MPFMHAMYRLYTFAFEVLLTVCVSIPVPLVIFEQSASVPMNFDSLQNQAPV